MPQQTTTDRSADHPSAALEEAVQAIVTHGMELSGLADEVLAGDSVTSRRTGKALLLIASVLLAPELLHRLHEDFSALAHKIAAELEEIRREQEAEVN